MTRLSHVVAAVFDRPWYIHPDQLAVIAAIVEMHVAGGRLTHDEIRDRLAAAEAANGPRRGGGTTASVGVIPIYGTITPRSTGMEDYSGGTSVSQIRAAFNEALRDDTVGSILLDFDSPGGYTDGVDELATDIREARGRKPIVAIADYSMASAAYYLGSQADEVVASPSSMVGWIGTVLVHQEFSKANELDGVTTNIIRNPPGKYGGNRFEPLSDKARAEFQQQVDDSTSMFHTAVAKGRGVSVPTVRETFGQGGGFTAQRAKAAGLVDRVDTFEGTIRRLSTGKGPAMKTSATTSLEKVSHVVPVSELDREAAIDTIGIGTAMGGELGDAIRDQAQANLEVLDEILGPRPESAESDEAAADELELRKLKHRARAR